MAPSPRVCLRYARVRIESYDRADRYVATVYACADLVHRTALCEHITAQGMWWRVIGAASSDQTCSYVYSQRRAEHLAETAEAES